MPVYIASEKGYFADEGLKSDIKVLRGGVQALAAVVAGDADVYLGPPSTAMRAIDKGQNLKVFGAVANQIPSDIVVNAEVAKKHGITADMSLEQRIKAMKGMTIGVNAPGAAPDQVLRFVTTYFGLDPDKDLTIAAVGGGDALLAAFGQKRIDGFVWSTPTSDLAVSKLGGQMMLRFTTGHFKPLAGFLFLSLIARTDWLTESPERAQKTANAIQRALTLLREHPDQARASLRTFFPDMDRSLFDTSFDVNTAAIPASLNVKVQDIELAKDFEAKTSGTRFSVPSKEVFTNDYAKAASR
jgi:NitT/TauT family transport system substrate-binding protein